MCIKAVITFIYTLISLMQSLILSVYSSYKIKIMKLHIINKLNKVSSEYITEINNCADAVIKKTEKIIKKSEKIVESIIICKKKIQI